MSDYGMTTPRKWQSPALERARKHLLKVPPNTRRGVEIVKAAFRKGDRGAAYALATWHLHGEHVRKNLPRAVALLEIAIQDNIPEALFDLANCYEMGAGVRKNSRKAYALYLRAALWGDRQSVFEVGRSLFYGIGVKQDRKTARLWLDRGEALGVADDEPATARSRR